MQTTLETTLRIIITYFILFSPIMLTLYLINRSIEQATETLKKISFSLVTILFSTLFLLGLLVQGYHLLLAHTNLGPYMATIHIFSPYTLGKFRMIGPAIWFPSLTALLILIPKVRREIAKHFSFSAENPLHALSLALSMFIPIVFLTDLIMGMSSGTYNQSESEVITSVWAQSILLALTGFIGVGWLSRTSFKASLRRLGLGKTRAKHIGQGILLGIALSFLVILLEFIASHMGLLNPNITKATDELIGPLFNSIFGVLTLGLAAALGEETIFRGAILPRFGIFYSSLLFALMHVHYGISLQLFIVFLLGLLLGVIRNRYNTTVSMIVHATYNITLGIIGYLSLKFMT